MTPDRESPPSRLAAELGLTPAEAAELKRAIQFCEVSGPQRWERGERIVIHRCSANGGSRGLQAPAQP